MTWQSRLASLVAAGGFAAGVSACSSSSPEPVTFQCNANPDPCCSAPDGEACRQSKLDSGRDAWADALEDTADGDGGVDSAIADVADASETTDAATADAADGDAAAD